MVAIETNPDPLPYTIDYGYGRAIDIADEFPAVEVIGVDLAPIQPR